MPLTYTYTAANQLATRTPSTTAYDFHAFPPNQAKTFDGLNRDAAITALTGGGYDANGLLINEGASGRQFAYDKDSRLVSATSGLNNASLSYDPTGRLQQESVTGAGAGTTQFLYDGARLVAEYDASGALLRRYVHGPGVDEPIVWYDYTGGPQVRNFLHADERRSIIATSNDAGTVTPYAYGPYGEPNAWGGSRFAYTGQIALPELALYHYKARAYDPASHRFLQTDPIGYQGGENLYRYAFDDPIDLSDPTGLCNAVGVSCNGGPPNGPDTPDKFVVMYNQTENPNGNLATFHYQLENSNGQQLTGFDYYALENLSNLNVNGATVNNVQLQKQTSYGDPLPNGQYIDDVGISQNKGVSLTVTIDQTFTVKYNGNTYDLSGTTQFQHISTEVNGKVSNNVVSLKP